MATESEDPNQKERAVAERDPAWNRKRENQPEQKEDMKAKLKKNGRKKNQEWKKNAKKRKWKQEQKWFQKRKSCLPASRHHHEGKSSATPQNL